MVFRGRVALWVIIRHVLRVVIGDVFPDMLGALQHIGLEIRHVAEKIRVAELGAGRVGVAHGFVHAMGAEVEEGVVADGVALDDFEDAERHRAAAWDAAGGEVVAAVVDSDGVSDYDLVVFEVLEGHDSV